MQHLLVENSRLRQTILELEREIRERCQNYLIQLQSRSKRVGDIKNRTRGFKKQFTLESRTVNVSVLQDGGLLRSSTDSVRYNADALCNTQMELKSTRFTNKQSFSSETDNTHPGVGAGESTPLFGKDEIDQSTSLVSSASVLVPYQVSYPPNEPQQNSKATAQLIRKYEQKLYIYEHIFLNISKLIDGTITSTEELNEQFLNNLFTCIESLKQQSAKISSQNKNTQTQQKQGSPSLSDQNRLGCHFNKSQLQKLTKELSFDQEEDLDEYQKLMEQDEEYQRIIKQLKFEGIQSNFNSPVSSPTHPTNNSQKDIDGGFGELISLVVPEFSTDKKCLSVISEKTSEYRLSDKDNAIEKEQEEIPVERLNSTKSQR